MYCKAALSKIELSLLQLVVAACLPQTIEEVAILPQLEVALYLLVGVEVVILISSSSLS